MDLRGHLFPEGCDRVSSLLPPNLRSRSSWRGQSRGHRMVEKLLAEPAGHVPPSTCGNPPSVCREVYPQRHSATKPPERTAGESAAEWVLLALVISTSYTQLLCQFLPRQEKSLGQPIKYIIIPISLSFLILLLEHRF